MILTAEADLSAASAVWSSGAVGTAGCAAEGKLLFVHGVVVSHLDLVDIFYDGTAEFLTWLATLLCFLILDLLDSID